MMNLNSQFRPKTSAKIVAALGVAALCVSGAELASGEPQDPAANSAAQSVSSGDSSTSLADQTELAITVYNSDIALVRDVRNISIPSGPFRLKFMDIAATVNPATVHFRSLTDPAKLDVTEQNYEYDLLDPAKLLHKYVGKEITLEREYLDNNTTKREQIKATLLADNNGTVWKIGNDIVTNPAVQSYHFPDLPVNLYDHPTLLMSLENSGAHKQQIEASYLAQGLSWNADYVLTVARDDKAADLDGWVTIGNNSGTAFHNAKLQLVAGQLNRLPEATGRQRVMDSMMALTAKAAAPQFQQESFSEYHLYTLGRKTSVEDKETKQISLLQGSNVPVEKLFVVNGQNYYYRAAQNPGAPIKDPVMVYYKFKNSEKSGLGMPLPAGNLRVYQKDSHGGVLFIGEDRIDHTPKDETISVKIGNAFDVVSERKQTDYKKIDTHTWEMEYEITLRNHKDTPIVVQVNEPIGGDWEMLSSSYKPIKTGAFAAQFNVPVDKDGTAVLTYRIRAKW
jgi:hypothetical protein